MVENRVRTLSSIRNEEQYKEYLEDLDRCTTEYEFFLVKNPTWESMDKKAEEYDKDSEAYVSLKNRARLIKKGEYGTALEKNIAAYVLAIAEYEAKQTNLRPIDIGRGFANKDPQVMKYLQDRFMKARAERVGNFGAEYVNIGLQKKEDVITEIFEEYDFINLEKPELSLVPGTESPKKVIEAVRKMFEQYIDNSGISKEIEQYRNERASGFKHYSGPEDNRSSMGKDRESSGEKPQDNEKERG